MSVVSAKVSIKETIEADTSLGSTGRSSNDTRIISVDLREIWFMVFLPKDKGGQSVSSNKSDIPLGIKSSSAGFVS